jgi:hypothetical protein
MRRIKTSKVERRFTRQDGIAEMDGKLTVNEIQRGGEGLRAEPGTSLVLKERKTLGVALFEAA